MFAENHPNVEHRDQVMAYVSDQAWYDDGVKTTVESLYSASVEDLHKDLVGYARTLSATFRTLAAVCYAVRRLRTLAADNATSNLFNGNLLFALQSIELNLCVFIKTELALALKMDNDDGYASRDFLAVQNKLLIWVNSLVVSFFNKVVTDGSVTNVQYYTVNSILRDLHNHCYMASAA